MKQQYTSWMAGEVDKTCTPAGNLRAPTKELLAKWVVVAWEKLSADLITKSFLSCGLTNSLDGSQDDLIVCLQGEANAQARALLRDPAQQTVQVDEEESTSNIDVDDDLDEIDVC